MKKKIYKSERKRLRGSKINILNKNSTFPKTFICDGRSPNAGVCNLSLVAPICPLFPSCRTL